MDQELSGSSGTKSDNIDQPKTTMASETTSEHQLQANNTPDPVETSTTVEAPASRSQTPSHASRNRSSGSANYHNNSHHHRSSYPSISSNYNSRQMQVPFQIHLPTQASMTANTMHSSMSNSLLSGLSSGGNNKDSRWLTLEVCREFQRGKCTRSDQECKFAHPPSHVEINNGKVIACFDNLKGRCQRVDPPCKYLHPPQHLKDVLQQNGRNNLFLKSLAINMAAAAGNNGGSVVGATTMFADGTYGTTPFLNASNSAAGLGINGGAPATILHAVTPSSLASQLGYATASPSLATFISNSTSPVTSNTGTPAAFMMLNPYVAAMPNSYGQLIRTAPAASYDQQQQQQQQAAMIAAQQQQSMAAALLQSASLGTGGSQASIGSGQTGQFQAAAAATSPAAAFLAIRQPAAAVVASQQQQQQQQQLVARTDRLEVCREFQQGFCPYQAASCPYAHPPPHCPIDSEGLVTVCVDFIKGKCARDSCKYFHPPDHLTSHLKTLSIQPQQACAVINSLQQYATQYPIIATSSGPRRLLSAPNIMFATQSAGGATAGSVAGHPQMICSLDMTGGIQQQQQQQQQSAGLMQAGAFLMAAAPSSSMNQGTTTFISPTGQLFTAHQTGLGGQTIAIPATGLQQQMQARQLISAGGHQFISAMPMATAGQLAAQNILDNLVATNPTTVDQLNHQTVDNMMAQSRHVAMQELHEQYSQHQVDQIHHLQTTNGTITLHNHSQPLPLTSQSTLMTSKLIHIPSTADQHVIVDNATADGSNNGQIANNTVPSGSEHNHRLSSPDSSGPTLHYQQVDATSNPMSYEVAYS